MAQSTGSWLGLSLPLIHRGFGKLPNSSVPQLPFCSMGD